MSHSYKLRERSVVVEAILWTGDNNEDIADFCAVTGASFVLLGPGQAVIVPPVGGSPRFFHGPPRWIVRHASGRLSAPTVEVFAARYEPAP